MVESPEVEAPRLQVEVDKSLLLARVRPLQPETSKALTMRAKVPEATLPRTSTEIAIWRALTLAVRVH
jgi:hypothetical protein